MAHQNGMLPESILIDSPSMRKYYIHKMHSNLRFMLYPEVSNALGELLGAFEAASFKGKQPISITSGYRPLADQQVAANTSKNFTAVPGKSNHGWSIAIDFWWGMMTSFASNAELKALAFKHPNYKWLFENGWRYGWYNPEKLRDNAVKAEEWWHWEYQRQHGTPYILSDEYKGEFDYSKVDLIIKSGGKFKL